MFLGASDFSYEGWAGLFAQQWFKILAFVTFLAMYYHVWVGIRDIWMDYIKPVGIRLTLQVFTHRFGAVVGVLVSSVLFGLVHVQSLTAASAVIVVVTGLTGLGFAVLTLSTKRLGGAIVGHVTYNSLVATYVLVVGG